MSDSWVLDFYHLPQRLPNRNQELQATARSLRKLDHSQNAYPVRIYGPSGAGKSSIERIIITSGRNVPRRDLNQER